MQVTLVYSPAPRTVVEEVLAVPPGATVDDALHASTLPARFPNVDWSTLPSGCWGRAVDVRTALRDGDRIEWCRPLTVDPKVARRERFRRQGARATGLFARRREGGKPGY